MSDDIKDDLTQLQFLRNPALVLKITNVLITCLSKALMDHSLFWL